MDSIALLSEVEDVLRTMPSKRDFIQEPHATMEWCGRAAAVMENLGPTYGVPFNAALSGLGQGRQFEDPALLAIPRLLHQARHRLRMETLGPVNTALGAGAVFDYFDELRQIIEPAANDLLFIDPYIGSEFVSRYLPHVRHGVVVRPIHRT